MKKYLAYTAALFLLACNSNDEQSSKKTEETGNAKIDSTQNAGTGATPLSGKFEIIDYKKDNVKVDLPKISVLFTSKGDFIKSDGNAFFYKIEGDSITILLDKNYVITKSGIEFLKPDKTSFTIKNPKEKTEITYQKVKE